MTSPVCAPERFDSVWFGVPGQMDRLPIPNAGMSDPLNRGGVDHELPNGVTTTRRTGTKRDYALSWDQLTPDQADVLVAYYAGVKPTGPYRLLDPRWRNQYGVDGSTFGAGPAHEQPWKVSGGAWLNNTSMVPPAGVVNSRVMEWVPNVSGASLWHGAAVAPNRPDKRFSVPYIPGLPWVSSVYAKISSGTLDMNWAFVANTTAGVTGLALVQTVTLTTTWTRLLYVVPPQSVTAASSPYCTGSLQVVGVPAGRSLYFAGPMMQSQAVSAARHVVGLGAPLVGLGADPMGSSSTVWWRRSHTLTLRGV